MYQWLAERVPLFGANAPWAARLSFLLFVFGWFWELNNSLHLFLLTSRIPLNPKQHLGLVMMSVIWGGWQLLNAVLLTGIAYRGNWARVMQLIVTVFGMLLLLTLQILKLRFDLGVLYFCNAAATVLLFFPSVAAWFSGSVLQARRDARS